MAEFAERPQAEYRGSTDQEWRDFQQHFQARELELGECGRPYGTPCKYEHACLTEMTLECLAAPVDEHRHAL